MSNYTLEDGFKSNIIPANYSGVAFDYRYNTYRTYFKGACHKTTGAAEVKANLQLLGWYYK